MGIEAVPTGTCKAIASSPTRSLVMPGPALPHSLNGTASASTNIYGEAKSLSQEE